MTTKGKTAKTVQIRGRKKSGKAGPWPGEPKTKAEKTEDAPKPAKTRRVLGPRSQTLPGMEQVRSSVLDALCEDIGDARGKINEGKLAESAAEESALVAMQESNLSAYKHAGVELARVPGADRLRVRLVKEQGHASRARFDTDDVPF